MENIFCHFFGVCVCILFCLIFGVWFFFALYLPSRLAHSWFSDYSAEENIFLFYSFIKNINRMQRMTTVFPLFLVHLFLNTSFVL